MWSSVLICALVYCIPSSIVSQTTKKEAKLLSQPCANGDELAKCRDSFFNATSIVPSGNKEAICKLRAGFSTCLEDAICTCQYPNDHQLLETAYKEIMRNNYEFANESCEKLNTEYTLSPGIACKQSSQNSSDHYRITQSTSEQPFIVSLKDNCSALAPCFAQRDRNFEVALFNKSLSTYCQYYDTFLKCFEMKACECNMQTDQSMLLVDDFEKQLFIDTCSLLTDTRTITPEIICAGACSLPDPGVTCTKEFEKNIAASKGDEDFCRHLATYTECYDRLVCQCGLYQDQNIYTAVSIAKYTFEVKSDCKRFSGLVFPSLQSGFPCPNDTKIQDVDKIIKLNTSQGDFVKDEEHLCPGVSKCFIAFDANGSVALHNKDLKAICQALYEEIKCLEETTCACGTLQTRFSGMLMSKRTGLRAVCGQGVIDVASPISCGDENICSTTSPVDSCTNILNKQAQYGDDPKAVMCENHLNYGMCIKDVACSCDLVNNGSSATTIEIYQLLNKNAATYDSLECLSNSNKSESGLVCDDKDSLGASGKRLNLTWSLSSEKLQLVTECPSMKVCFEQDDTINEDALVNFDYKRVCRNQLNTIRCMEKCYCECGLDKDDVKAAAIQEKIAAHISECSKYAAFGIKKVCGEDDVCLKARTEDVCSNQLTNATNSATKCIDYTNYLSCVFDVACMCGLVKNGTEPTAEAVYRNVTEVHYLMLSHRCSLQSVPVSLFQDGFECYDTITALPVTMGRLQLSFAEDQAVQQWAGNCPTVIKCAGQYDIKLAESLNIKNFHDVCQSTIAMIQCSQKALTSCGLFSTTEAAALNRLLASKLEGCDTGKTTLTRDPGSSNFGTDAIVSANNSQPQVENVRGDSSTIISSASSTFVAMLLFMTSLWIMCQ